jgi:hypothetical protein
MSNKMISFAVPLTLNPQFYLIIDDGRIFRVFTPANTQPGETLIAEIDGEDLIASRELPNASETTSAIDYLDSRIVIGSLINENVEDDLVLGFTLREKTSPTLVGSLEASFIAATSALTAHARVLDETYHVTDKVKAASETVMENVKSVDETYHVSQTVKETATSIDSRFHVTEHVKAVSDNISHQAQSLDETYKVTETVKSVPTLVTDNVKAVPTMVASAGATIAQKAYAFDESYKVSETVKSTAAAVQAQASTYDEKFHVTETVKSAAATVVTTAQQIDSEYHVTDRVKQTAEAVAHKVHETLAPTPAQVPEMDEETHK